MRLLDGPWAAIGSRQPLKPSGLQSLIDARHHLEHVPSLTHLLLPSGVPNSELEGSEVKGLAGVPSLGCCVALRPEAWPQLQGVAWLSSPPGGPSFPLLHLSVLSGLVLMSPLSGSLPDIIPQAKEVALTFLWGFLGL